MSCTKPGLAVPLHGRVTCAAYVVTPLSIDSIYALLPRTKFSIVVPVSLELFMNVAPLRLFATVVSCSTVGCMPGGCGTRGVGYVPGNMF